MLLAVQGSGIAQASRSAFSEQLHFSAEDDSVQKPVAIPQSVLAILRKDERVGYVLKSQNISAQKLPLSWFSASAIHLTDSNKAGLVVMGLGPLRGADVNTFWVFCATARGYQLALTAPAHDLFVKKSRWKGHRDIELVAMSAAQIFSAVYRFDGRRYSLYRTESEPIQIGHAAHIPGAEPTLCPKLNGDIATVIASDRQPRKLQQLGYNCDAQRELWKGAEIMKSVIEVGLVAIAMVCVAGAQEPAKPPLQRGMRVEMAEASHAVPMPAADEKGAIVMSVTANGNVFLGVKPVDVSALSGLKEGTVYVKADARAPYQKVLTVLDALRGRSVVLLTAPTLKPETGKIVPPYGLKLVVGSR